MDLSRREKYQHIPKQQEVKQELTEIIISTLEIGSAQAKVTFKISVISISHQHMQHSHAKLIESYTNILRFPNSSGKA